MLIAAGALIQFVKFMQITLFIVLPVTVAVVSWTIFMHYRRKRKPVVTTSGTEAIQRLVSANPEVLNIDETEADYIHYDHTALIREYKRKLIFSHARFTALQQDHQRLQDQCNALINQVETPLLQIKNNHSMENNNNPQMGGPGNLLAEMAILENDKRSLQEELNIVNESFRALEKENLALSGQVQWLTGQGDEKDQVDIRWQQENAGLQERVAEQEYLRDIVEDKKTQIAFLQDQLELRIRNYHQADQQVEQLRKQLETVNTALSETNIKAGNLTAELQDSQEQVGILVDQLAQKDTLITEKESVITWLENTLQETKQQNEMLNAMLADNKDLLDGLQNNIAGEQSRFVQLEQKFESNRQLLRKIYRELAGSVESESPVIELKSVVLG